MMRVTEVVPFQADHRRQIDDVIEAGGKDTPSLLWRKVEEQGTSITLMINAHPVMCGGVVALRNGEALAWAAIDRRGREHVHAIHRVAKAVLASALTGAGQITAHVVWDGFPQGHRWVKALGFRRVSIEPGHRLDGRLSAVYVLEAA